MNNLDEQTKVSTESFINRLTAFDYAIAYAKMIDGCDGMECEFRKRILAGEIHLIEVYCDICMNKSKF